MDFKLSSLKLSLNLLVFSSLEKIDFFNCFPCFKISNLELFLLGNFFKEFLKDWIVLLIEYFLLKDLIIVVFLILSLIKGGAFFDWDSIF